MYKGHSSHVTNVRFTLDGNYLISVGGHDKSIFQWKYINDKQAKEEADTIEEDKNLVIDEFSAPEEKEKAKEGPKEEKKVSSAGFEIQGAGPGTEFMAVKPFKGEVEHSIPTGFKAPRNAV